ncbi:MAG: YkgJ family cysteine cluster protein [Deltaproteobacteria bacterium]|nr:YkgJ family cysteine cluster protein [Deltaproteobacteria bacterium]MBW2136335.1 YkgJ family cysteine cluster protein [Deltaproteobacteria bacterium]
MNLQSQEYEQGKRSKMTPEHLFTFRCGPGVSCYTQCCQDVSIVLTPYDVVRMKMALGMSSDTFLEKYTVVIPKKGKLIPLVILKMREDKDKKCPFVTETGCSIYEHRPWPCRMYPLDMDDDGTFRFISDALRCKGLAEKDPWRIGDWLVDQGMVPYDRMNTLFAGITVPLQSQDLDIDNPRIFQMTFMALYNIDKFREFVFRSSFLDRFEVEKERIEKIKRNDEELLRLAFDWIKFGVLGQKLFWIKDKEPGGPTE